MTHIKYKDIKFTAGSMAIIEQAKSIIEDFENQGYTLSLRQLYYQFVGKALIENSERSYKRLGSIITDGRLAGEISWHAIEDRHRTGASEGTFDEDEESAVNGIEYHIRYDFWGRQDDYVEVWVEKDALLSVVGRVCEKYLVPHMACKGYLSASEAWRAGQRFEKKLEAGKNCYVIHLGDHDPSGIDMTRDNGDRIDLFTNMGGVEVKRIALNMNQVKQYNPPPNPAKITDSRAVDYIKKFGSESWELDALSPSVIDNMLTKEIEGHIDGGLWKRTAEEQKEKRKLIASIYDRWDDVKPFLEQLRDE